MRGLACFSLLLLVLTHGDGSAPQKQDQPASPKGGAWTYEEVRRAVERSPNDPYLQYVMLQLARRENRLKDDWYVLDRLTRPSRAGRRERVDLFNTFTGALAVQESLQLDTMLEGSGVAGLDEELPGRDRRNEAVRPKEGIDPNRKVALSTLQGPAIKSHPWEQMLAGHKTDVGVLASCVPEDFYLVEFKSAAKLTEALETANLWGDHLLTQMLGKSDSQEGEKRIKKQLGIQGIPPGLFDAVGLEGIAITGSDLYVGDGSDLTLLVLGKKIVGLRQTFESALKKGGDTKAEAGTFEGVPFTHVYNQDRSVNVYTADPRPDLHVRSNSKAAFERVLRAIAGKTPRLGESKEYAYIRTLMPRGAAEEDGLVYLSDPCIRRLVGPRVKLTQQRRLRAFNHLKMIEHACLLFRTEHGRAPKSFEELAEKRCAPGVFGKDKLACPGGGTYTLAADGMAGVSSVFGRSGQLTPLLDLDLQEVTHAESHAYAQFLQDYNQYWRTFFDPIAVRVRVTPKECRLETIVLPLIDNTIYTTLAQTLGGQPVALDGLPAPEKAIHTISVHLNKEAILNPARPNVIPREVTGLDPEKLQRFLRDGIGEQVSFHVLDSSFPFNAEISGFFSTKSPLNELTPMRLDLGELVSIGMLVQSLTHPACLMIPVKDGALVDEFLAEIDRRFADDWSKNFDGWVKTEQYRVKIGERQVRVWTVKVLGLALRVCWCRMGDVLVVANQVEVLQDLDAQLKRGIPKDKSDVGHAMFRVRPEHWKAVLRDYQLGWAENHRSACQVNQQRIANVARGWPELVNADGTFKPALMDQVFAVYGVKPACPDGGAYRVRERQCECEHHGSLAAPTQHLAPAESSATAKSLRTFAGLRATLTFMEDGLHAVVTIDRK